MHALTRFLWWCSGAVPEIAADSPTERAKHAGLGGAVLSTWCLASFAGGYALYVMTDGSEYRLPFSMLGGLVWGLVIFNIDRFLVSSLRKSESRSFTSIVRSELLPASPRIAFAIVIALTIAEPLELRLFAPEIEDRIETNRDALVGERQTRLRALADAQVQSWRAEIAAIDADLARSRERLETLQREYIEESDGRGGSRQVGAGPLTEIKRAELQRATDDHAALAGRVQPRRTELQQRLDTTDADLQRQLAEYRASLSSGYLARREALAQLYDERPGVAGAVWGIFLLMVMIEVTPLLLKIFASYGPYDAKVAMIEESATREAELQRDYRVELARYHYELAGKAERAVEDASHEADVAVRTGKAREAWDAFSRTFTLPAFRSVDHLLQHLRQVLSAHRQS